MGRTEGGLWRRCTDLRQVGDERQEREEEECGALG
jgi:hypothetical protein